MKYVAWLLLFVVLAFAAHEIYQVAGAFLAALFCVVALLVALIITDARQELSTTVIMTPPEKRRFIVPATCNGRRQTRQRGWWRIPLCRRD